MKPLATENQAEANHDRLWELKVKATALTLLAHTDLTGKAISASDLHSIGEPSHPNRWGTLFKSKELAPYAYTSGVTKSRRPQRRGGWEATYKLRHGKKTAALAEADRLNAEYFTLLAQVQEVEGQLF